MSSKTEVVIEPEVESPTVSVFLSLMCDQSDYRSATKKGLSQHKRIRQLISQVDGIDAYTKEGNTETVDSEVKKSEVDKAHCQIFTVPSDYSNCSTCDECEYFSTDEGFSRHILDQHELFDMFNHSCKSWIGN